MDIDYLHVSAFTDVPGRGNSAGVCEFDEWPTDAQLAHIAQRVALPVTACLVGAGDRTELRWLSKSGAFVQSMCGHGTLAASCVMAMRHPQWQEFEFATPGGPVPVRRDQGLFFLALPRWNATRVAADPRLVEALGGEPVEMHEAGRDMIAVYAKASEVRALSPDMAKLLGLGRKGFIATARGDGGFDCVSRFFCPSFGLGVDEDPVTGSAHCSIAPFWAGRLNKSKLRAHQASSEGGEMLCEVTADSVVIGAPAVLFERGRVAV